MQYRYTVTFDAIEGCFTGETRDKLKKRLMEDTELLCGANIKVTVEDQFCIDANREFGNIIGVENTIIPENESQEIAYAKMLTQFLKNIQNASKEKNDNLTKAMTAAINALVEKGLDGLKSDKESN